MLNQLLLWILSIQTGRSLVYSINSWSGVGLQSWNINIHQGCPSTPVVFSTKKEHAAREHLQLSVVQRMLSRLHNQPLRYWFKLANKACNDCSNGIEKETKMPFCLLCCDIKDLIDFEYFKYQNLVTSNSPINISKFNPNPTGGSNMNWKWLPW